MSHALTNKDYRGLLEELRDQGWDLAPTGRGHWKATPPDPSRQPVIFSETRDFHGFLNITRQLREQGLEWPRQSKSEARAARREEQPVEAMAEVVPIVRSVPFKPVDLQLPPAAQPSEDELYRELCDQREITRIANAVLGELEAEMAKLQAKVDTARRERDQARADYRRAKDAFDAAFGVFQ